MSTCREQEGKRSAQKITNKGKVTCSKCPDQSPGWGGGQKENGKKKKKKQKKKNQRKKNTHLSQKNMLGRHFLSRCSKGRIPTQASSYLCQPAKGGFPKSQFGESTGARSGGSRDVRHGVKQGVMPGRVFAQKKNSQRGCSVQGGGGGIRELKLGWKNVG